MKNKFIVKVFLLFCIFLFSLMCISCASLNEKNTVNASYVEVNEYFINGDFFIVESTTDLNFLLDDNAPEKYNHSFFTNNSLVVFKNVEPIVSTPSVVVPTPVPVVEPVIEPVLPSGIEISSDSKELNAEIKVNLIINR